MPPHEATFGCLSGNAGEGCRGTLATEGLVRARALQWLSFAFAATVPATAWAGPPPAVTISAPSPGTRVGDSVPMQVTVASPYDLKAVTAKAPGAPTSSLVYYYAGPTPPYWAGTNSLVGAPFGTVTIVVTATDVLDVTGTASVTVNHDNSPTVNVSAPLAGSSASGLVHLSASCADDDPAGCASLRANLESTGAVLATGTSSISTDVSVPSGPQTIRFTGTDSSGQTMSVTRAVTVTTGLVPIATLGDLVLDIDDTRILYNQSGAVYLRDRGTGADTLLYSGGAAVSPFGKLGSQRLTTSGAVFETSAGVHLWRADALTTLVGRGLSVAGQYAVYGDLKPAVPPDFSDSRLVKRLDVTSGVETLVETTSAGVNWWLAAPSGETAWSSQYSAHRRTLAGVQVDYSTGNAFLVTFDGVKLTWSETVGGFEHNLWFGDVAGAKSELVPMTSFYDVMAAGAGGYLAYTRLSATNREQVWVAPPSGTPVLVTFTAGGSHLEGFVAPDELVVASPPPGTSGSRHLWLRGGTTIDVASAATGDNALRRGCTWYVLNANSVSKFPYDACTPPGDAGPSDASSSDTGASDAGSGDADASDTGTDDAGASDSGLTDATVGDGAVDETTFDSGIGDTLVAETAVDTAVTADSTLSDSTIGSPDSTAADSMSADDDAGGEPPRDDASEGCATTSTRGTGASPPIAILAALGLLSGLRRRRR